MKELTVREVAARLGLTTRGVRERLRLGTLRGRLAGDAVWLIPIEEVERAAREPPRRGRPRKQQEAA